MRQQESRLTREANETDAEPALLRVAFQGSGGRLQPPRGAEVLRGPGRGADLRRLPVVPAGGRGGRARGVRLRDPAARELRRGEHQRDLRAPRHVEAPRSWARKCGPSSTASSASRRSRSRAFAASTRTRRRSCSAPSSSRAFPAPRRRASSTPPRACRRSRSSGARRTRRSPRAPRPGSSTASSSSGATSRTSGTTRRASSSSTGGASGSTRGSPAGRRSSS